MQWQIINHINELLITRVFYAPGIKVSPPIGIPGTFPPIVFQTLSRVYTLLFRASYLAYDASRDDRMILDDIRENLH